MQERRRRNSSKFVSFWISICHVSIFAMLTQISGIDTNINGNAVSSQGVVHQLWQISIYRHYWRCAQAKKTLPPQYWEPNIKRLNEVQSVKIPRPRKCFFSRFRWQSGGKGAAATILSPFSRCRLTNHGLNQQPAARALIFTSPRTLSSALQSISISCSSPTTPHKHTTH